MDLSLELLVRLRAKRACEYCRYPGSESSLPFTLEHIVARKHRGPDDPENLVFACAFCNQHKGTDLTGIDPPAPALVRLFNPRADRWGEHFRWDGVLIVPFIAAGRVTEYVLSLNHERQLARRLALVRSGWLFRADL